MQPVGAIYANGQHWDDSQYVLPPEAAMVEATLYYQTASKEYIEFLAANGGIDSLILGELWGDSKSPPQVVAQAWSSPRYELFLPIASVNSQVHTQAPSGIPSQTALPNTRAIAAAFALGSAGAGITHWEPTNLGKLIGNSHLR